MCAKACSLRLILVVILAYSRNCECDIVVLGMSNITVKVWDYDIIESMNITMVPLNGRNTLNGTLELKVPINDIQLNFILNVKRPHIMPLTLASYELDGCKFLENTYSKNKIITTILNGMKRSVVLPKKCPIEAHKVFAMKYFDVHFENIPTYVSGIKFAVTVNFLQKRKKVFDAIVCGSANMIKSGVKKS